MPEVKINFCCSSLKLTMTMENGIEYRSMMDGNLYFVADILSKDPHKKQTAMIDTSQKQKIVQNLLGYRIIPLMFKHCPYCGTKLSMIIENKKEELK